MSPRQRRQFTGQQKAEIKKQLFENGEKAFERKNNSQSRKGTF